MEYSYNELFTEIFTIACNDDYENAVQHLLNNKFITEEQFQELWEILCEIHERLNLQF